jgi:hypothetical protein
MFSILGRKILNAALLSIDVLACKRAAQLSTGKRLVPKCNPIAGRGLVKQLIHIAHTSSVTVTPIHDNRFEYGRYFFYFLFRFPLSGTPLTTITITLRVRPYNVLNGYERSAEIRSCARYYFLMTNTRTLKLNPRVSVLKTAHRSPVLSLRFVLYTFTYRRST